MELVLCHVSYEMAAAGPCGVHWNVALATQTSFSYLRLLKTHYQCEYGMLFLKVCDKLLHLETTGTILGHRGHLVGNLAAHCTLHHPTCLRTALRL